MMNKKAQLFDMEVLATPGFVILLALAWGATIIGFFGGRKFGLPSMPLWQLITILGVEVVASYIFVNRMS